MIERSPIFFMAGMMAGASFIILTEPPAAHDTTVGVIFAVASTLYLLIGLLCYPKGKSNAQD